MSEEIWKDIEGYEGLYQVSNYGRVRSLDRYVKQNHNTKQLKKGKLTNEDTNDCDYGVPTSIWMWQWLGDY